MQRNAGHIRPWPPELSWQAWGRGHWLALGGIALAMLVVWGTARSPDDASLPAISVGPPSSEATVGPADSQLAAVRALLEREVEARKGLARELAALRAQVEGRDPAEAALAEKPTEARAAGSGGPRPVKGASFDRDMLVAAGVDARDAEELRAVWEETEMEKIRLADRAAREGWMGTRRYREERRGLDTGVREELSPDGYDRYLYATGKPNRAMVTDVIRNSAGGEAGLAPGDAIISYDDQRVFDVRSLRDLVTSGRSGETVRVEVMRGNSKHELYVPRGPLGLMLLTERQPPL